MRSDNDPQTMGFSQFSEVILRSIYTRIWRDNGRNLEPIRMLNRSNKLTFSWFPAAILVASQRILLWTVAKSCTTLDD